MARFFLRAERWRSWDVVLDRMWELLWRDSTRRFHRWREFRACSAGATGAVDTVCFRTNLGGRRGQQSSGAGRLLGDQPARPRERLGEGRVRQSENPNKGCREGLFPRTVQEEAGHLGR